MNELMKVFKHPEFGEVRTLAMTNGTTWFCAADICKILQHTNPSQALKNNVDYEDILSVPTIYGKCRNPRPLNFINEAGLYSLLLRSRLPLAKEFKRWVAKEVLPQLNNMLKTSKNIKVKNYFNQINEGGNNYE